MISSVDPTALKLTKMDDEIYEEFRKDFPDLKIDIIKEDELKSAEAKEVNFFYIMDNIKFCRVRLGYTLLSIQ